MTKIVVPNVPVTRLMEDVSEIYNVSIGRAYITVVEAARSMGYPRPHKDGIWPRDLFALLKLVDRRLA